MIKHYNNSDNDSGIDTELRCISCRKVFIPHDVGTCKECYDGEKLNQEINALKVKVDFLRLSSSLDHGNYTDVVLIASSMDGPASPPIPAHKIVLINRSTVFKAMLENEMKKPCSSTIKISEVSYDTLRTFINYLYTAEACLDEQVAVDLLVMSDKYQVIHLKNHCEKFLVTKLSPEKSLTAYVFAHQYNAQNLFDAALLQMTENMEKVTKSEKYEEIVKHFPLLVVEIYEAHLIKQAKKEAARQNGVVGESTNSTRPPQKETRFQFTKLF